MVIILVVLVAFRYHLVVVVDVAVVVVVVVDGVVDPRPGDHLGCPCCLRCCCVQISLCQDPHIPP